MLTHDLATVLLAERERAIRDAGRAHALAPRPSFVRRTVGRLALVVRRRPAQRSAHPTPGFAHGVGDVAAMASPRTCDTHGQGAC